MNNPGLTFLALLILLSTSKVYALEEPTYTVIKQTGNVELRKYDPYLVAETVVDDSASRNKAANVAFRRLFKYITGSNTQSAKIEMTAPVKQSLEGEKIAMTAPVSQRQSSKGWVISFVVPGAYDLNTVPQPTDANVVIREVPGNYVAALQYSGRWTDKNVERHRRALLAQLRTDEITVSGPVTTAYYNSPFSLPFARRNEVLVSIANPLPM